MFREPSLRCIHDTSWYKLKFETWVVFRGWGPLWFGSRKGSSRLQMDPPEFCEWFGYGTVTNGVMVKFWWFLSQEQLSGGYILGMQWNMMKKNNFEQPKLPVIIDWWEEFHVGIITSPSPSPAPPSLSSSSPSSPSPSSSSAWVVIQCPTIPGWWFQPIWKILVKLHDFPRDRGENKQIFENTT